MFLLIYSIDTHQMLFARPLLGTEHTTVNTAEKDPDLSHSSGKMNTFWACDLREGISGKGYLTCDLNKIRI